MKEFLNVKDISNLLNISERKIRTLFNYGVLNGKKIGNKWITTSNVLKELIERGGNN